SHLIDTAWGTTSPCPQKAVERAELTAEVIAVKDHLVSLSYKGRTRAVQEEAKWTGKRYWGPDPKLADRVRQIDEKVKELSIPEPQTRGIDATIEAEKPFGASAFETVGGSDVYAFLVRHLRLDPGIGVPRVEGSGWSLSR